MITVGVTVINEYELSRKCIESVQKHTTGEFELVVCDNGSTDPTTKAYLDSLRRSDEIKLTTYPENKGCAPSWNTLIRMANSKSSHIAIVHNDSEVIPGWRELLSAPMQEPGVVFVGTERCGNHVSNRYVPGVINKDRVFLAGPIYFIDLNVLFTYNMMMDEQFVPIYFDDMDWMLRFKLAGFKLAVVNERFPHVEFTTSAKPRGPEVVGQIVDRNQARLHRKFEGTFVSHLPGWTYIDAPDEEVTWVHTGGKNFALVDRHTDSVVNIASCVAPYRVPSSCCQDCTNMGCWKKKLPKEELDFVASRGLPLLLDYPVNRTVKGL